MCEPQPDFDTVEEAGLDGTLRTSGGVAYDWREVALALQKQIREREDHFALWEAEFLR
jgi:hypothetical protein